MAAAVSPSPATSDKDLEHIERYVIKIKDTKFKQRLDTAIREFNCYTSAKGISRLDCKAKAHEWVYQTDYFSARFVYDIAENRYGIYFKDTNEYGLFCSFYDGEKFFNSFLRSDATFEAQKALDDLRLDEPI